MDAKVCGFTMTIMPLFWHHNQRKEKTTKNKHSYEENEHPPNT